MPSEAYGILNSIKTLYNSEPVNVIFTPRKYGAGDEQEINLDDESADYMKKTQIKYSEFIEQHDSFNKMDNLVKLVRSKTKLEMEKRNLSTPFVCKLPIIKQMPISQSNSNENTQGANQKWQNPPKSVFKPFLKAIQDFDMIKNNDRILIGLSGGKDSLSLLHILS